MILEVKDLNVNYCSSGGYVNALKGVTFSVEAGKILGIVGESGSGKSTFAFSALNLLPPDAKKGGQILFRGKDIFSLNKSESERLRGNQIGLIFQDPVSTFNPVLSIGYQFQEILKYTARLKSKSFADDVISDSFKKVRLNDPERILKSYPHQLSGGQLQRVAIAMAVALRPQILIADEPTSSLDVTIESQITHLFKELKEKLNLTLIFITHNLDLVKVLCDDVVVIRGGEVCEAGKRDEIFSDPKSKYTKSLLTALKELEE